jgi:hypothetical protein
MVDLEDLRGAPEGRDQLIELLPIIKTVDFEPNGQQAVVDASTVNCDSVSNGWRFHMQKVNQFPKPVCAGHVLLPPVVTNAKRVRGSDGSDSCLPFFRPTVRAF